MTNRCKEEIIGFHIDTLDVRSTVQSVMGFLAETSSGGRCRWLACINPHSYVESLSDNLFASALHSADWLIPDGSGIVIASRILSGSIYERVTGSDIFWGVSRALNERGGGRVFFLDQLKRPWQKYVRA